MSQIKINVAPAKDCATRAYALASKFESVFDAMTELKAYIGPDNGWNDSASESFLVLYDKYAALFQDITTNLRSTPQNLDKAISLLQDTDTANKSQYNV